jgi:hypothetical protein
MTRKNLHFIIIIAVLFFGMASCYVVETTVAENTTFIQKKSKWKIAANPDNYENSEYLDRVSRKLITTVTLPDGDIWSVTEIYNKRYHKYCEQKVSMPKLANRKTGDILFGSYGCIGKKRTKEEQEFIDSLNTENRKNGGGTVSRIGATGGTVSRACSGSFIEFDSTGYFIKSIPQISSDSRVPSLMSFGQYKIKGDTLELLMIGHKTECVYIDGKGFRYCISLIEPTKEYFFLGKNKDTLISMSNDQFVASKSKFQVRMPITRDLYHK